MELEFDCLKILFFCGTFLYLEFSISIRKFINKLLIFDIYHISISAHSKKFLQVPVKTVIFIQVPLRQRDSYLSQESLFCKYFSLTNQWHLFLCEMFLSCLISYNSSDKIKVLYKYKFYNSVFTFLWEVDDHVSFNDILFYVLAFPCFLHILVGCSLTLFFIQQVCISSFFVC